MFFKHPQVRFYSEQILISENIISFDGELDFHGIKIRKKLEASYFNKEKTVNIEGVFSIVLTDFNIKLPSLMLVKMDDFADLSYKLVFEKK
ncbi:YceI family protein [Flavobacteriaceae bacterium]|nr:YceI family protein [Flavobacteriaceae bacterium]